MTVLLLSIQNIRRNMNRSLAAVMGMAVAAALFLSVTAMATGYTQHAYHGYRTYMAADVVMYATKHNFGPQDALLSTKWMLRRDSHTYRSDLAFFHPTASEQGWLTPEYSVDKPFDQSVLDALAQFQGVRTVFPTRTLPCIAVSASASHSRTSLRERDLASDQIWDLGQYIAVGRNFEAADDGRMVALLSQHLTDGEQTNAPGDVIDLLVPVVREQDGKTLFDFSNTRRIRLEVLGLFAVPTYTEVVSIDTGEATVSEVVQRYWQTEQILVPKQTMLSIVRDAGGHGALPAYQLGLAVDSMFYAKETAQELAHAFPEYTVISVPEQAERSLWEHGQPTVPQDLKKVFVALAYLGAGLIVMANMHVLVSQRRHELGVLKAIGAAGREIFGLVLFESLLTSVLGGLVGFAVVRGFFGLMLLYTDVSLFEAGVLTLESFVRVMALTVGVSCAFGIVPALWAVRHTTVEVLRDGG